MSNCNQVTFITMPMIGQRVEFVDSLGRRGISSPVVQVISDPQTPGVLHVTTASGSLYCGVSKQPSVDSKSRFRWSRFAFATIVIIGFVIVSCIIAVPRIMKNQTKLVTNNVISEIHDRVKIQEKKERDFDRQAADKFQELDRKAREEINSR